MTNREEEKGLDLFNFIDGAKSNKLNNFISEVHAGIDECSILNVCKYILEHKNEWQEVINDIHPFLSKYGLAYEDSKELNTAGENLVVQVIWLDIERMDTEEYNLSVFGTTGGVIE